MNKFRKIMPVIAIAAFAFLPMLVLVSTADAQVGLPPGVSGEEITLDEIKQRIQQVANFLVIVGVVLAVIFIIWGGISYMMAGSNEESAKKAKERIKNGIIGAIVVLGVGVILNTLAGVVSRSFFGG